MSDVRAAVQAALQETEPSSLKRSVIALLGALGYSSQKTVNLDGTPRAFLDLVDRDNRLAARRDAQTNYWKRVDFLFQLTNDEIPALSQGTRDLFGGAQDYRASIIESFVFLAIELDGEDWSRTALAGISREVNRVFPMPAVIIFLHGSFVSLAVIDRRQNRRDLSRDVIEKRISIVKDIRLDAPHRAHLDILGSIALANVKVRSKGVPTNFRELYDGWIEALSAQALNERFYRELANWFFWATKNVEFPAATRARDNETTEKARREAFDAQNQISVIRLLTRLIFVWFIKEKGLVPNELFDVPSLRALMVDDPTEKRDASTYYMAVLQNLFFATLNTEMSDDRKWRTKGKDGGLDGQYLIHTVYRFRDAFRDPDKALELFKQVPFLNGGLFECLDRDVSERDIERNPDLKKRITREGKKDVLRIDGFSERADNALRVPNKLFFASREEVDLSEEYDAKSRSAEKVDGLIELFSRYKFTVEENTPVEEEVALDPELLGKVFENLLASYNADTRTTARKKSGSFYTPREVVDYMVDEALIAYFEQKLAVQPTVASSSRPRQQALGMAMPGEFDLSSTTQAEKRDTSGADSHRPRLVNLLNLAIKDGNPFSSSETDLLISAIDNLKALDPACGSGAFPMGLLQKLIHVLHRLDPDNARWKAQNRKPLELRLAAALQTPDPSRREIEVEEAEAALAKLDRDFSNANKPDYARKLYLIDKCIFGVDIQPIAVQIAKLRFFISLVVSQKIDRTEDNANITALPNLETKLVAANSLIPIERPRIDDLFRNKAIEQKEAELRSMNARYFSARTAKTKRARREDIARLRDELAELLKAERGLPAQDAKQMATWDPFDQNSSAGFFDPEWMFQLAPPSNSFTGDYRAGAFDLVIGNPPYVRQEAIKDQKPALEKHYGGKDRQGNPTGAYAGTADLFIYFIQRGIELLSPGGAFAYITSNKWYRAKYGQNLRGWLNRNAELRRVVDFGDAEVFDAVAYPTILVATRRAAPVPAPSTSDTLRVMNWPQELGREEIPNFPAMVEEIGFDMPQKTLAADGWQLEPQAKRGLLDRIRAAGMPLGQYVEGKFYRGVLTGFNEAFVIDGATKDRLIGEHASSAELIKPFLRGRDIKRWRVEPKDLWLIRIESSENQRHSWTGLADTEAEKVFALEFPAIHSFMSGYRKELVSRYDQGKYFWELRSCAYWEDFDGPKILYPDIFEHQSFAWDLDGFYTANTGYFIPTHERWLIAFLNSTLSEWFYSQISNRIRGGYLRSFSDYMKQIPIPSDASVSMRSLMDIGVGIQLVKSDGRFEQLLNGFVYELFFKDDLHTRGLTLFEEAERAGLGRLSGLEGPELLKAAESFAATHLIPGARLRTMLSDVATLDVVRIIEGRE
ncbi:Eco57I restriction-modification methylase domain-containing protein [Cypionkella sinensis]|uniref:site-specific DNA-methyltransferase (adenine-specific) n=1 Tax=Cypionkella sinensis TaxID=1756043 RepID=A0ABV7J0S6_9RHOB